MSVCVCVSGAAAADSLASSFGKYGNRQKEKKKPEREETKKKNGANNKNVRFIGFPSSISFRFFSFYLARLKYWNGATFSSRSAFDFDSKYEQ